MRNCKKFLLGISMTIGLIGVFIFFNSKEESETVYMSASWSYRYADIEELSKSSDLIALIRVNKLVDFEEGNVPSSTFESKIIEPIHGCEKGDLIHIYMTGAIIDDTKFEIKGYPLLEKGEEFLIFTSKNDDGTYTMLGGPQGRLVYQDGKLNSLHNVGNSNKMSTIDNLGIYEGEIDIKDEDANIIIDKIKAIMN